MNTPPPDVATGPAGRSAAVEAFPAGRLPLLCRLLRSRGLTVTPALQRDVVDVVLRLVERGDGDKAREMRDHLRPLLCTSPADGVIFDHCWKDVFGNPEPEPEALPQTALITKAAALDHEDAEPASRVARGRRIALGAVAVVIAVAVGAWALLRPGGEVSQREASPIAPVIVNGNANPPRPPEDPNADAKKGNAPGFEQTPIENDTPVNGTPLGFSALLSWRGALVMGAVLFTLAYLVRRWLEARYLRRGTRGASAAGDALVLGAGEMPVLEPFQSGMIAVARRLRQPLETVHPVIEPHATVRATVRAAGCLRPVWTRRRFAAEHLFLVEECHQEDHWSLMVTSWIRRLGELGVPVTVWSFRDSLERLFPADGSQECLSIGEVLTRLSHLRVIICARSLDSVNAFTGVDEPWLAAMTAAEGAVALLTPADMPSGVGLRQFAGRLRAPVFRFDPEGVESMAAWFAGETTQEKATASTAPAASAAAQARFSMAGQPWLEASFKDPRAPQPHLPWPLLEEWLGALGMRWLRACAIFPRVHRQITLALGEGFALARGHSTQERADAWLRLAQLPWLRAANLPDWMRAHLVSGLALEDRSLARDILHALIIPPGAKVPAADRHAARVEIAGAPSLRSYFRAQMDEAICRSALSGRLGFPLPASAVRPQGGAGSPRWRAAVQQLTGRISAWNAADLERLMQRRIALAGTFLMLVFALLAWHVASLQLNSKFAEEALRAAARHTVLPARRGEIVDVNGVELAGVMPVYDLVLVRNETLERSWLAMSMRVTGKEIQDLDPAVARQRLASMVAGALKPALEVSTAEIESVLNSTYREKVLKKGLDDAVAQQVARILESERISFITLRTRAARFHPMESLASHVIGYVSQREVDVATGEVLSSFEARTSKSKTDLVGMAGIEVVADKFLRGQDGFRDSQVDTRGREILGLGRGEKPASDGATVRLTLDSRIQARVEEIMVESVQALRPKAVAIILMEAGTGRIVAMCDWPTFDLAEKQGSHLDQAISALIEPGSFLSIVPIAEALDRKRVTEDTVLDTADGTVPGTTTPLRDTLPAAKSSVKEIVSRPSYIGAYRITSMVAPDADEMNRILKSFGFGSLTGIELPQEEEGFLPSVNQQSKSSLSRMAVGYGVSVTPLQMASAMGIIANDGMLVPPTVIADVQKDGAVLTDAFKTRPPVRVIGAEAAQAMARCLADVVSPRGSGEEAAVPGYTVMGKTGTAQLAAPNGRSYRDGHYCVSFTGYLQMKDGRKLVGTVVVNDPLSESDTPIVVGGKIAAPIFSRVMGAAVEVMEK